MWEYKTKKGDKGIISNEERKWYCLIHLKNLWQEQIIPAMQKESKDKIFVFQNTFIMVYFEYIIAYSVFASTHVPLGVNEGMLILHSSQNIFQLSFSGHWFLLWIVLKAVR